MIKVELEKLLRGRTLYWLSKETGIRWATLASMANQKAVRIDLPLLDRICQVLRCQPGDLLTRKRGPKPTIKRGK